MAADFQLDEQQKHEDLLFSPDRASQPQDSQADLGLIVYTVEDE